MPRAVITGTSSGMGRATARLLAEAGWEVIGIDVTDDEDEGITRLVCDITDRNRLGASLDAALGPAGAPAGRVDLVANIAGIFPPTTLETFSEQTFRQVFDVNVLGTLNVIAEVVPRMSPGAAVVNFASVDAFTVSPGQLVYGASKAAVVMLTKSVALELAEKGIRVNAIAPGWVDTPGNKATGRMEAAAASVPLRRVAQPEEIARWVEILGSPDAGFMTGETIVLSGGDVIR